MIKPGQLLASKYAVERVIGRGGGGIVVAAKHEPLALRVALKFLRPDAWQDPEMRRRFLREAQIAATTRSAHVVRGLGIDTLPDGQPFLVMELLEGCDLAALLGPRGRLPRREAVDYVRQACAGLADVHALGIVHRDVKPSNLFLSLAADGSKRVKIIDFGMAELAANASAAANGLTPNSIDMGSPPFVAPEQLRAERGADAKSDLWALGAVLFTLLAGHSPFERRYLSETYRAILSGDVPDLTTVRADVERPLAAIVERCLAADRERRFASMNELRAALAPFSSHPSRREARGVRHAPRCGNANSKSILREGGSSLR